MIRLLRHHGIASRILARGQNEDRLERRLVSCLNGFLETQAIQFVKDAEGPVLFSYQGDGAPLLCRAGISFKATAATRLRRSGKSGQTDVFCQGGFLMALGPSGPILQYLTRPPVHLDDGKTSWRLFTATNVFFQL